MSSDPSRPKPQIKTLFPFPFSFSFSPLPLPLRSADSPFRTRQRDSEPRAPTSLQPISPSSTSSGSRGRSAMGGCCCCFITHKPPRENPIGGGGSSGAGHHHHHHHPGQMVTYSEGLGAAERLSAGFRTFRRTIYDKNPMLFGHLKSGQSPKYMVFACSDSRVYPSVTLDLKPGEAFTVRNIASLVPAYHQNMHLSVASAIEFAVTILKVKCIVVIGHSCCGGIRELLSLKEDNPQTYHCIDNWVKIGLAIKKKVERVHALLSFDEKCTMLEIEAVNLSLRNLATYPFVKDKLDKGTLKLIGARYDFVHGSFQTWHA